MKHLDIAADKLKEAKEKYGSTSIFTIKVLELVQHLELLIGDFLMLFGGVSTLYGTVCGGIGQAGQELDFGERISHDPFDHLNSNVIIIWGRNPAVTDVHLWKILKKQGKMEQNSL